MPRLIAGLSVALAVCATAVRAAAPPTVVSAEAELVRVSVSVTDKQGRPVTDLNASEFVLTDDGQAQEITHFVPGSPIVMADEPEPDSAPAATATHSPAPAAAPPRHVVLAIDDLHLSGSSVIRARESLRRFVQSSLAATDEVAIATTSGAGVSRAFTTDRSAILTAIDTLAPNERRPSASGRSTMNQAQADAIERGNVQALELAAQEITTAAGVPAGENIPMWAYGEAKSQARQIVAQAVQVSNNALAFLEEVVRSLQALPGRKVVVLLSDGFLLAPPTEPAAFDLRRLIDASARADVAVYPLLTRGVTTEADASTRGGPQNIMPGRHSMYARLQELSVNDTLASIAEGTGGRYIRGTNDMAAGLRQVLADNASSYLLAYSPRATDNKARFHKIEVKVPNRPGLQVRARRGYLSRDPRASDTPTETAEKRRESDIRAGLSSLVPRRDVPVDMRADFVDRAPEGPQVIVSAHVDAKDLRFQRADGRYRAELEFVRVVADERGRVIAPADGQTASLDLTPATYEKTIEEGIGFQSAVPVTPGRYEVRLAVREGRTSQVGSARQWVDVPDTGKGGLALSDVFLFAPSAEKGDTAALRDAQATRRYPRDGMLYYVVHVYNPARDDGGAADVVTQTQIRSDGVLQGASPVEPVVLEPKDSSKLVRGGIALTGLAPGRYELRLLAVDRKAGTQADRRIDFSVD